MLIEIKHRYSGEILHSGDYIDLRAAVISADLRSADLRSANLQSANLRSANLQSANLRSADLRYADLQYANLRSADLQSANLQSAILRYADLQSANLRYANLRSANFWYADLQYANLQSADLQYAKNAEVSIARTLIAPAGDLRVWKLCQNKVLIHLLIPNDARRSNATGRKCRAEFAEVLDVIGDEVGISRHDSTTIYRKGERVTCREWCEDRWAECGGGIHFYLTREEAEAN